MSKPQTGTQKLLKWCQHVTKDYSNVSIQNFSKSWKDGLAFCAIIHHFRPDLIDYDSLKPENPEKNIRLAFDIVKELGIIQYLEPEDLMLPSPEPKTLQMQVYEYYQYFSKQEYNGPQSPISTLMNDKDEQRQKDLVEQEQLRAFLQKKDKEEQEQLEQERLRKEEEELNKIKEQHKAQELANQEEEREQQEAARRQKEELNVIKELDRQGEESQENEKKETKEPKVHNSPITKSQWLSDLIHWRNPMVSGTILVLIWLVTILIKYYQFSFVTLACRVIQFTIIVGMLQQILQKFKIQVLSVYFLNAKFETKADFIQPITDLILTVVDYLLPIIFIKSPIRSIRFLIVLQIISVIGKWFSGFTLALLVVHAAMIVPLLFTWYGKNAKYKQLVDNTLTKVNLQVAQVQRQVAQKIPPFVSNMYEKAKSKLE